VPPIFLLQTSMVSTASTRPTPPPERSHPFILTILCVFVIRSVLVLLSLGVWCSGPPLSGRVTSGVGDGGVSPYWHEVIFPFFGGGIRGALRRPCKERPRRGSFRLVVDGCPPLLWTGKILVFFSNAVRPGLAPPG